jgi:hypothetical protein
MSRPSSRAARASQPDERLRGPDGISAHLFPKQHTDGQRGIVWLSGGFFLAFAGTVRGVLLWNVWEKVENARALISEGRTFTLAELDAAIPI